MSTRWSIRAASISSILKNYTAIINALQEINDLKTDDSAIKARGFKQILHKFETYLAMKIAEEVFEIVDDCNIAQQSKSISLTEAQSLAIKAADSLSGKRKDSHLAHFFKDVENTAKTLDADDPQLPRKNAPQRFESIIDAAVFSSVEEYYHRYYYELLNTATTAIRNCFNQDGMKMACNIENILIRAANGEVICTTDNEFQTVTSFNKDFDVPRLS